VFGGVSALYVRRRYGGRECGKKRAVGVTDGANKMLAAALTAYGNGVTRYQIYGEVVNRCARPFWFQCRAQANEAAAQRR